MRVLVVGLAVSIFCIPTAVAQRDSPAAEPYNVSDAYEIYSLLLPQEESYGFSKGTLIIQQETVSQPVASCVTADAARRFKDAIADYSRLNEQRWLLQQQFNIENPYEIASSDRIESFFKNKGPSGWKDFYKRYPDSGGYIIMSAVGFNKSKTQAFVYMGSSCGELCGRWLFHLFNKVDDKWKEAPGVSCITMS